MRKIDGPGARIVISVLALISVSLACSLVTGGNEPESPADLEDLSVALEADLEDLSAALEADLVDDRAGVLEYLGNPDAFDISSIEVEGQEVRRESWRYFQYATRVDFVDGQAVWTVEIEALPEGTILAAWYDPLAFEVGMSADQASQLVAEASPAGAHPQLIDLSEGGEDLSGGSALVGDQILIGLQDDRVVYVETVALVPVGGE